MPTIYESFWEAVDPDHVGSGREVPRDVHVPAPSNTTERFEPPNFLLRTPESKWLSIAGNALEKHKSTLDQGNTCLAAWESNMVLNTKSAIVNRSTIYLNNPVHIALHAAQNHSVTCYMRSEATLGTTPESEARADLAYMRDGRTYAVLEYKKPGQVSERCARRDFERGVPKGPETFADWMVSGERRFTRDSGADDARFLLQQAAHYSSLGPRFVALFDWNALVLLVFPPFQGLSYAYITEITDNRKFRPALLGFLLFAYRHNLKKHDNCDLAGGLRDIQPDVLLSYGQAYRRRVEEDKKRNRGKPGPRGPTSCYEIGPHMQEPLAGSQPSMEGGRIGNGYGPAPAVPKRYDDDELFSERGQNALPPHGYHWDAAATGPSLESHLQGDRSRDQQASDRYVTDNQGAGDGTFQNHHANSDTDTYAATSSAYSNKPNLGTRVNIPDLGREQGPRQEDSKAPSRILATQHEASGGRVVDTQTREVDRGAGRPPPVPPPVPPLVPPPVPPKGPGAIAGGAGLYGASRYNYHSDGENYASNRTEHFGTDTGNSYPPYGGPLRSQTYAGSTRSVDRDELSRKNTKGKNGKKILGIF